MASSPISDARIDDSATTRVAFFGTHPKQFNGYSKVVYELCKQVAASHKDLQMHVFGFQNMHNHPAHRTDALVLPGVDVYDAMANEEPKAGGFGVQLVKDYVARVRPHVCVVFNDLAVLNSILNELKDAPTRAEFKVIAYIDQVYLYQKREHLAFVNAYADAAIAFTPEWRDCLVRQGMTRPCHVLVHGINPSSVYPIPRALARRFFALPENDFLVLNLNRNQPRKRWDICLQAFAEVVARLPDAPIKMVVGTELHGGWDLVEVYRRELTKRGVPLDKGLARLVVPGCPQQMSDAEINILYNVADIGINTCDGEGFGLCNFEQAAVGVPQVVPRVGGFVHFFSPDCAQMMEPVLSLYQDSLLRDAVGGQTLLTHPSDYANAIVTYYEDAELRARHGAEARRRILRDFGWEGVADTFHAIVRSVCPQTVAAVPDSSITISGTGGGDDAQAVPLETMNSLLTGDPPLQAEKKPEEAPVVGSPTAPAGGEPAGGEPAGGEPAGGEPAGGEPAGGEPAGGEPAGAQAEEKGEQKVQQGLSQSDMDEIRALRKRLNELLDASI